MAAYEMTVTVRTQYLEDQSNPDASQYVFAYAVTIKNTGSVTAQLISRHWLITDANEQVQEVRGLALGLLIFIVWWTMFSGHKDDD